MRHEIKLLRLISLMSMGAIAIALISQYVFDMQPCAWCVFQRLLYLIIGCVALILTFGTPKRARLFFGIVGLITVAIAGIISAIYQEKVAANAFSCAQTFADQFMTKSGLDAAIPWVFGIYASCMEARIKVLGIEYAWWSMAMFSIIAMLGMYTWLKLRR